MNFISSSLPAGQVERLMHISDEVDQELECFARHWIRWVAALLDPLIKQIGGVSDGREDIPVLATLPSLGTGEETQLRRMIGNSVRIMQRRRPLHLIPDLVSPGCDRGKSTSVRSILVVED
jgi:hypothetical protein